MILLHSVYLYNNYYISDTMLVNPTKVVTRTGNRILQIRQKHLQYSNFLQSSGTLFPTLHN